MAKHLTKEERLTKRLKNNWVIAVASVAIGGLVVLGNAAGAFKDLKEALLGKAETRTEGPVIRFAAQDGAGCLPLPANARVTVAAAGAAPQQATVNGCEARLPWAIDWRTGRSATIEVAGASGFERAEPSESYRLGDGEWTVKMRFKPGAPRIVVRVFDYATTDAALDQQLDQFHTIVRTKIRILAESLAARDPEYRYVADLTVEPMRRELTASASAALAEWRNSGALM